MVKKNREAYTIVQKESMASGVWGAFLMAFKNLFLVTILSILYIDAYACD